MVFTPQRRCWATMAAGSTSDVSRKVPKAGGAAAAISAIRSSPITPGPLGIADTSPTASAPAATAARASPTLEMQQILTRVRTRASTALYVMAGLVPAIHAFFVR